jgi:predicted Zn-ribbon and HTH transcriptional regulator
MFANRQMSQDQVNKVLALMLHDRGEATAGELAENLPENAISVASILDSYQIADSHDRSPTIYTLTDEWKQRIESGEFQLLECHNCDYAWIPKVDNPERCPQCSTSLDVVLMRCTRCEYEWIPVVDNPQRCPDCRFTPEFGYFQKI